MIRWPSSFCCQSLERGRGTGPELCADSRRLGDRAALPWLTRSLAEGAPHHFQAGTRSWWLVTSETAPLTAVEPVCLPESGRALGRRPPLGGGGRGGEGRRPATCTVACTLLRFRRQKEIKARTAKPGAGLRVSVKGEPVRLWESAASCCEEGPARGCPASQAAALPLSALGGTAGLQTTETQEEAQRLRQGLNLSEPGCFSICPFAFLLLRPASPFPPRVQGRLDLRVLVAPSWGRPGGKKCLSHLTLILSPKALGQGRNFREPTARDFLPGNQASQSVLAF